MENASKALIIAGGILLTMLILALVMYVVSSMGDMADSQDRKTLVNQIEEFNKSYEAYNKNRMYGTDVITVSNKAKDNNKRYADDSNYHVEVVALDENNNVILIENNHDFKISVFKCIGVEYNQETGIIKKMTFKRIALYDDI